MQVATQTIDKPQGVVAEFRAAPMAALNKYRLYVTMYFAAVFLAVSAGGASATEPEPDPVVARPTLDLDVDTMLFYIFEGANIIIVALGAVVFLTIGFILGKKILDLIRSAISSL